MFLLRNHGLSWLNHGFVTGSSLVARGLNSQPELFPSETLKKSFLGGPSSDKKWTNSEGLALIAF